MLTKIWDSNTRMLHNAKDIVITNIFQLLETENSTKIIENVVCTMQHLYFVIVPIQQQCKDIKALIHIYIFLSINFKLIKAFTI